MHHARYTPERFIDSHQFDQFKAATEILFRRRLWVDDTPVLGVECAMPSLSVPVPKQPPVEQPPAAADDQ